MPPSCGEARGKLQPAYPGRALKRLYGALPVNEFEIGFPELVRGAPMMRIQLQRFPVAFESGFIVSALTVGVT